MPDKNIDMQCRELQSRLVSAKESVLSLLQFINDIDKGNSANMSLIRILAQKNEAVACLNSLDFIIDSFPKEKFKENESYDYFHETMIASKRDD